MDTYGINEPISPEEAKAWMRYPDTMPSWLMSAKLDDDLEKLNNNEKKRQRVEERRGKIKRDMMREDDAFFYSKELARGANPYCFDEDIIQLLLDFGIDAYDHSTWQIHAGVCRGEWGDNCQEVNGEFDREQEEEKNAAKLQRQIWSIENEEAVKNLYKVGDIVVCYGDKVGIITKKNKVTCKVKMKGTHHDNFKPLERNVKPHQMTMIDKETYSIPKINDKVKFKDRTGRRREGSVVDVDFPLFLAAYEISNRQRRVIWLDTLSCFDNEENEDSTMKNEGCIHKDRSNKDESNKSAEPKRTHRRADVEQTSFDN